MGKNMETCKTCKHWLVADNDNSYGRSIISPYDPVTYVQEKTEEAIALKWGYNVRYCRHPKLEFHQRPEQNALSVIDGSQYYGALLTGEDFGCILHEAKT
jgi:hypothetical protein